MSERQRLEESIAALESQRATLGDDVVDASIAALREKLAALLPPSEQQRKQTTILFADVSGFTAMSETMDAEDVSDTMNALWQRLDTAITSHGGLIDKHIGDAVMAIWGAESARENDPEQAIRAALVMREALADFVQESRGAEGQRGTLSSSPQAPSPPPPLQMRIGLNTGPVLLGEVGTTGEFTAMGDTVNTASRLEHAAPVGGILISHDTYRHVRGIFDVQPQEPLSVKGKVEPLQVYVVKRAKPRAFRLERRDVAGIETPMIGREAELKQLQDAFYITVEDAERQMVTVSGEAGVGKSRLLYEFDNWIELVPERVRYFNGRARQETRNLPYALIRDLFAFRFQIQDSDTAQVVRQKIEAGVGEALGMDEAGQLRAHFIGHLLGYDFSASPHLREALADPQQLHDRAMIYLGEFFRAIAALRPTVIFLEDIHWADGRSLDVLSHLARTTAEQRLLIVCLARPSLFERRPHWGEGQSFHTRLELGPLSRRDSYRLLAEILRKMVEVPEALRELVVDGAEGNPFYLEELIKMLIEDGVIIRGEEQWQVEASRLTTVRVPTTLTGVLQARLDRLSPEQHTTLQRAAVVGRIFWDQTVNHLATAEAGSAILEADAGDILGTLRDKEMIFRRETSAFAGTQEFIFKHAVLREVTYESVLKRVRRVYHALVANWLIEQSGERVEEYTGLIADHLELAGQTEQAVTYLCRAGGHAADQFANEEAVAYFSRALDLLPETKQAERYALLVAREKVYDLQGKREAQSEDLAALESIAEALTDEQRRAEIALRQAKYVRVTGDYSTATKVAQAAIRLAQTSRVVGLEAKGYLEWGKSLWLQRHYKAAQSQLEEALALARTAKLRRVEGESLRMLGNVFGDQGDYPKDLDYYEQALHLFRAIGDRRGEGASLHSLGYVSSEQGDHAGSKDYYRQAIHIHREIGDGAGHGHALGNLAHVLLRLGDYTEAKVYAEQALHMCRETGDRRVEAYALVILGDIASYLGDYAQARVYAEQALYIGRKIDDRLGQGTALAQLGLLSHYQGDHEAARDYSQQALAILQDVGDRRASDALMCLGHALAGLGQLVTATDAYEQAIALRWEVGEHHLAIESLAGLARVSLAQGDLSQAQTQVEEILNYLEANTPSTPSAGHILGGTDECFRVYLTCYRVLRANQDPRAEAILNTAHSLLQERAAKIEDEELRRSYLENVEVNRVIVAEWKKRGGD